jgi:small-conductance mechanosensitive channel
VSVILNSFKRLILVFATLVVIAAVTILLYDSLIAAPINGSMLVRTVGLSITIAFSIFILFFIRRTRPLMARLVGEQAATVLQIIMASIAVLFIVFAVFGTLGASPESLLTGAGFASITIGLIISTFVGGLLAGALVFTTHKLRVGDTVIVNNVPCSVVELTPLVTRVRTDTGLITIPNSAISSGTIVITKVQKYENSLQNRLPYVVGDRVVTTYMASEGTVTLITALRTVIQLETGREITLLNSSILSGAVGVARITGGPTPKDD